jgi:hypothetical protein
VLNFPCRLSKDSTCCAPSRRYDAMQRIVLWMMCGYRTQASANPSVPNVSRMQSRRKAITDVGQCGLAHHAYQQVIQLQRDRDMQQSQTIMARVAGNCRGNYRAGQRLGIRYEFTRPACGLRGPGPACGGWSWSGSWTRTSRTRRAGPAGLDPTRRGVGAPGGAAAGAPPLRNLRRERAYAK